MEKLVSAMDKKLAMRSQPQGSTVDTKNSELENHFMNVNKALREQIEEDQQRFDELQEAYEKVLENVDDLTKERDALKLKSVSPSRRIFNLPPDLALASVNSYASLVDQLVECLMDLKVKEKEITSNHQALSRFKVIMSSGISYI